MNSVNLKLPSNKKFGYFITSIFIALCLYFLIILNNNFFIFFALMASISLVLSLFKSDFLRPFNMLWMRFGYFLGLVFKPILLGVIFFILITPIAMITRLFGRDELKIKKQDCASYWKKRSPLGPESSSFKQQF